MSNIEEGQVDRKPVLVTTEFRGVFFGYMAEDYAPADVTLINARNCVYWDAGVRGFLGLAESGPGEACKIGPRVPKLTLYKITSVTECTGDAVTKWEAARWR